MEEGREGYIAAAVLGKGGILVVLIGEVEGWGWGLIRRCPDQAPEATGDTGQWSFGHFICPLNVQSMVRSSWR